MYNTGSWQSHAEYRILIKNMKARYHLSDSFNAFYRKEREKLSMLNLDPVGRYAISFYSTTGRPAIHQAQILRSLILFALLFNKTSAGISLTEWVNTTLPTDLALIALVGCSGPDDLPPLGSYYDFMDRFWPESRDAYAHHALLPAGKNSRKPSKNIGSDGKLSEEDDTKFSTQTLVDSILSGKHITQNREAALQDIFYLAAVLPAVKASLIQTDHLTLSGDGTAIHTHASPYGSRLSSCGSPATCPYHKDCPRHYSDPDADWGWDSSEKSYYFGRTLYMICCRNNNLAIELPVLMKFTSARRHDSINFLYAFDELEKHCPSLSATNFCLDSAHDNLPTYRLLKSRGINPLIDINGRSSSGEGVPSDIRLDKDACPVCRNEVRMQPWGFDRIKQAVKYRCPLKCGKISQCPHEKDCSNSSYGRTIYLKSDRDTRFQTPIPRGSAEYHQIYSERTACERVNARVLNDYHLKQFRIRGDDHYAFWMMIIGICIHLDARYKAKNMP